MSRKRMSPVDHAWLRMDNPRNWMVITSLITFDSLLDIERYKEIVRASLLGYARFTQRLAPSSFHLRRPVWEPDPNFDLDYHIQAASLPAPAGQSELQDFISELMAEPLDYDRPLWRFYVVQNYEHGSALVCRLHHCLADGIALVQVLLSMASDSPDASPDPAPVPTTAAEIEPGWLEGLLGYMPSELRGAVRAARGLTRAGLNLLEDPVWGLHGARQGLRLTANTAAAVARLALRWPDPQTMFRGPLGGDKRAAWSAPLPLDQVKQVSRALGATVNDVLLTSVAGALRRYLEQRRAPVEGLSIRGIVPVNLRPLEEGAGELGNRFGLVFLSLPIGVADPVQRLRALKCCMDGIKATPEAVASYGILGFLGAVHPWLQEVAISIFDAKGTAVMTNVPGPKERLYLAGAPINTVMAWVPQSGRVGLGVSVISYNGKVWLGIATDQDLVPDPEQIIAGFSAEFDELKRRGEAELAKRQAPFRPMLANLDEALQTLDELLAEEPGEGPVMERPAEPAAPAASLAPPPPTELTTEITPQPVGQQPTPPAAPPVEPAAELTTPPIRQPAKNSKPAARRAPSPPKEAPAEIAPQTAAQKPAPPARRHAKRSAPAARRAAPPATEIPAEFAPPAAPPVELTTEPAAPSAVDIAAPAGPAQAVTAVCQGRTRAGLPCKNPPLPGQVFCRVHAAQGQAVPTAAQEQAGSG